MAKNSISGYRNRIFHVMLLLGLPVCVLAQQRDSLASMREFMKICQSYQQLPLQLTVRMKTSANLVTAAID